MLKGRYTTALFLGVADCASLWAVFNLIAFFRGVVPWDEPIFYPLIVPAAIYLVANYLIEGYGTRTDYLSLDYTGVHVIATFAVIIASLFATFVFFPPGFSLNQSRSVIVLGYLALLPLTIGYRRVWALYFGAERQQMTVVFVGDTASCREFELEFRQMNPGQHLLCCDTGVSAPGSPPEMASVRAMLSQVTQKTLDPEAIVLREANPQFPADISAAVEALYFSGVPVFTLELFHETYWRKIPRYRLNQIWLFQGGFQITREPVFEQLKRLSDLFLAATVLTVFLPFLIAAAIAILLEDRGPVFFAQTRIGRNRVPFRMYKLRSMRAATEGDPYTREGDARITRVGRLLRLTRLDEVPQLWNVLRGEMSLIGPRAEWDRLVADYEKKIPCYHYRHLVKPGITGWAQVNYPYGANLEDAMRKLEYDLYYIRHFSFRMDASIVLKTVYIMLFGKGR